MDKLCIYCIYILNNYPLLFLPRDIRKLIISIMLTYPKVYCGYKSTIFINGDDINIFGDKYSDESFSLPGRQIDSINFSGKREIVFLSKSNNMIYVLHKISIPNPNYIPHTQFKYTIPDVVSIHCELSHTNTIALTKNGECLGNIFENQTKLIIKNVTSVSCGDNHTVFLTKTECFVRGKNDYGQLGLGHFNDQKLPQKLNLEKQFVLIECGTNYTFALTTDGIYSWGCYNTFHGQLGLGLLRKYDTLCLPRKVDFKNYSQVVSIKCSKYHTMMLTKSGELFGCGDNNDGQLGLGDWIVRHTFQKINFNGNKPIEIMSVCCGRRHTIAVTSDNECYGWGSNKDGQLGLTGTNFQSKPTLIKF